VDLASHFLGLLAVDLASPFFALRSGPCVAFCRSTLDSPSRFRQAGPLSMVSKCHILRELQKRTKQVRVRAKFLGTSKIEKQKAKIAFEKKRYDTNEHRRDEGCASVSVSDLDIFQEITQCGWARRHRLGALVAKAAAKMSSSNLDRVPVGFT
jgi:hypothetical protein